MNLFDLSNKTIIITGGAGHLGTAMSEALAAYGAELFILGHDYYKNSLLAEQIKAKYQCKVCEALDFDIDDLEKIKSAIEKIKCKAGKIDVLINNAAYSSPGKLEDYTVDQWVKGIDGTINAVFKVTQPVLQVMLAQGYGNIINIGSMYGMVAPNMEIYGTSGQNNPANYGAGKAAVIQFTRYIACVYGEKGIRANAISPGPYPNKKTQENTEFVEQLSRKTALKRIGRPEDLQGIVVYLASDSSNYLTGQNIAVDGGWTAW